MKIWTLGILILVGLLTMSNIEAQENDSKKMTDLFGLSIVTGSKSSFKDNFDMTFGLGINGRLNMDLTDELSFLPGFTYYFPQPPQIDFIDEQDINLSMYQFNGNLIYHIPKTSLYGLFGVNYNIAESSVSNDQLGENFYGKANEIGANMGMGFRSKAIFGELKYGTGFEQLVISLGFYISVKGEMELDNSANNPEDPLY